MILFSLSSDCNNISPIHDNQQTVIEANIIGPLVNLLQNAEFDIKKEAAWAISNATSGGSHDQIKYGGKTLFEYSPGGYYGIIIFFSLQDINYFLWLTGT